MSFHFNFMLGSAEESNASLTPSGTEVAFHVRTGYGTVFTGYGRYRQDLTVP